MSVVERIQESDTREIELKGDQKEYFFIIDGSTKFELTVKAVQPESSILIHAVVIAKAWEDCLAKIDVQLTADNCSADVHIVTFLTEWGKAEVDGAVTIAPETTGCSWELLEENIILWDKVQIKTLPMLDVRSSEVTASHGARIEKLKPEHLFYLQSKGVQPAEAKKLMVEGYINDLTHPFADHGEILLTKKKILERALTV